MVGTSREQDTVGRQLKAKSTRDAEWGDDDLDADLPAAGMASWPLSDEHETDALMGIAEVCERYGVSPRALRFYETKGLLAPRRINGTRVYNRDDRARLRRILRAKSLGMPLSEIKHYLDMYGRHGEGRIQQLTYVIEKTDAAIADLEAKRAEIDATLAELRAINAHSRSVLSAKRKSGG